MEQFLKNKQVVVISDSNGKCKYLGKIRVVNEHELNNLRCQSERIDTESKEKKQQIYNDIQVLKQEIENLKHQIRILKGE